MVLSCQQQVEKETSYQYLFMGHIYDQNPIIDKRISKKNYNNLPKFGWVVI